MTLSRRLGLLVCVMICVTAIEPAGAQQPDPDSPRYKGVVGLRGLLESSGDAALAAFINDKIAPSLRRQYDDKQLKQMLAKLRQDLGGATGRNAGGADECRASVRRRQFAHLRG